MGKVPLKTVLRNFLEHYHKLEASSREKSNAPKEYKQSGRETPPPLSLYDQEYIKLKELTESLKSDPTYPMNEGQSDVNRKKNRYKDILPYDKSRVILSEYPGVPGSDYINANYVRGSSGNQRAYIASQGPLHNTLVDFWRMIWETEVIVIVMACNEREAGKYKCETYWPLNPEQKHEYGNITVEHVKWRQVCPDFLVRTFRVCADNEERTICQFHYTTWPDHGVPVSVNPIIELVRLMRDVQIIESRPILVHCSAGCGRTGTICSIDYVWALLRTGKLREDFSLFEIICDMRRQRTSMVQTVEQYIFCYKAVATLFEQHLKLIDTHTYENIDGDGEPLGSKNVSSNQEDADSSLSEQSLSSGTNSGTVNSPETTPVAYMEPPRVCQPEVRDINERRNDHDTESAMQSGLSHHRFPSLPTDSSEDLRLPEKIVGKATVIRRPSIAKLKAIFDNPSTSLSNTFDVPSRAPAEAPTNNRSRLQRSQSIKDNIRNLNFNIQLEINQSLNQPQNRKSKSYTLSAAKLSVYKKHYSIGNLAFQDDQLTSENGNYSVSRDERAHSNEGKAENSNRKTQIHSRPAYMMTGEEEEEDDEGEEERNRNRARDMLRSCHSESQVMNAPSGHLTSHKSASQSSATLQVNNGGKSTVYSRVPQRPQTTLARGRPPSLERNNSNAPPKPPRTYQHVMDDSCIVRTSEGRLIVTVAQPRHGNPESSFIPININGGTQYQCYPGSSSIYETLGPRKFNISSPNLVLPDQVTYMPTSEASARINAQNAMKAQYRDTSIGNPNAIYGNSLSAKSYPRSMVPMSSNGTSQTPMPDNFAFLGSSAQYPVDVFGNQHFQYHQAKPIILQQNFFEPIYGTSTRQPFLPPRSSNLISSQAPTQGNFAPPPRPRSISQGTFKPLNQTYENIYSNREMCFSMATNTKPFEGGIATNSNVAPSFAPIRIQPKENVYAEIGALKQASKAANDATRSNVEGKSKLTGSKSNLSDSATKPSPFSKIINVFKVFRLKGSAGKSTNTTNTADNKDETHNTANFSTSNITGSNGTANCAINPLNGQPLSRPPHSHRFQAPTQWTQV